MIKFDVNKILLQAHAKSIKRVIETSIQTNTSIVIEENGTICEIKPPKKAKKNDKQVT